MESKEQALWVFGYGSLIWRPDFEYVERRNAWVHGYERRFWQASHDHRGTPSLPGRVVTLVPVDNGRCEGVVYRLPDDCRENILSQLDEREQDGYERTWLSASCGADAESIRVLTWLAAEGNPSWVGEQPLDELATLIANRRGPSGTNREYLLRLHDVFVQMGIEDPHVKQLVGRVEQLP